MFKTSSEVFKTRSYVITYVNRCIGECVRMIAGGRWVWFVFCLDCSYRCYTVRPFAEPTVSIELDDGSLPTRISHWNQAYTTDETRASPVALTVAEALSNTLPAVHVSAFSRSILPSNVFFKICTWRWHQVANTVFSSLFHTWLHTADITAQ